MLYEFTDVSKKTKFFFHNTIHSIVFIKCLKKNVIYKTKNLAEIQIVYVKKYIAKLNKNICKM